MKTYQAQLDLPNLGTFVTLGSLSLLDRADSYDVDITKSY